MVRSEKRKKNPLQQQQHGTSSASKSKPDKTLEKDKVSKKGKKTTPRSNKSPHETIVSVGKSVYATLEENLARSMGKVFADHMIAMANRNYQLAIEKKELSSLEEEEEDSEDEEETYSTGRKRSTKDSFVGSERRRKKCCPKKITLWLSSAEDALDAFANFLINLKFSPDGKQTLRSLYREDVRKTVEAVMYRQELFSEASPIAKGLARFDTHIDLLPSDRISVLDSSIMVETDPVRRGDPLNTLSAFKDETKELLCPRVTESLKHLSPDSAASVFSDIVKYVKDSFSFYKRYGDLPGTEFRILLADVNIKVIERMLSASKNILKPVNSSTLDVLNMSTNDIRTMRNVLQKIREWKPVSKDHPSRIDKARDVVLIPETGNVDKIPMTPTNLLQLVSYINALLSLERRNVFTNGFFNATCVLISQCLLSSNSPSIRPSKLASKIARDNLLRLHVVKNLNDGGSLHIEKEEPVSGESSFSEDDEEEEVKQNKKKTKISKLGATNEEDALSDLIYKTGGFYHDTSEFGKKVRGLIYSRDYCGFANYASKLIESGSKLAVQRLVSSLIDIITSKMEQCEELEKSCSCSSIYKKKNGATSLSKKEIVKMLSDPTADKISMARYFLNEAEPSMVSKHEAYVLSERLLPSDDNNNISTVTLSFFRKKEKNITREHEAANPEYNNFPNLFKFVKELMGEVSTNVLSVMNKLAPESNKNSLNVNTDTFLDFFSPLGSKLDVGRRIKSAVIVKDEGKEIQTLFSPVKELNTTTGLKLEILINTVRDSPQMKDIRQNAADLHNPNNAVLSVILFPPSSKEDNCNNNDEMAVLSKLAMGLFSIAEGCVAVVHSRCFDEEGAESSYSLVLDVNTMDKAVSFAASTLEKATAAALYNDKDMRPSRVLEGLSFVEGSLSYMLDRKYPKPTTMAKYTMSNVASRYLKRLKQHEKRMLASDCNNKTTEPPLAASDKALVDEVTNRATSIVKAQMSNAMGVAIIMSAAIKILDADNEEAKARLTNNNQATPQKHFNTRAHFIKNLAHLSITTAVAAASNMTKLYNQHFFDLIKEANDTTTTSEDYHGKEASPLGYSKQTEHNNKHGDGDGDKKGSGGEKVRKTRKDWLYDTIDSITEGRRGGNNYNTNNNTSSLPTTVASSKFLFNGLDDDISLRKSKKRGEESQESIMDKLNEIV